MCETGNGSQAVYLKKEKTSSVCVCLHLFGCKRGRECVRESKTDNFREEWRHAEEHFGVTIETISLITTGTAASGYIRYKADDKQEQSHKWCPLPSSKSSPSLDK